MEIVKTSNENYTLHVDRYPYVESRKLIGELSHWWDHPSRKKYGSKIENYSLDPTLPHSLESSFRDKLKHGLFCFLYHCNECISYGGMQVENKHAWMHRYAKNPFKVPHNYDSGNMFLIPYQIFVAKTLDCDQYSLTFSLDNLNLYKWYQNKIYMRKHARNNNSELINRFDTIENKIINNCEQVVFSLNLKREDINEFCKF